MINAQLEIEPDEPLLEIEPDDEPSAEAPGPGPAPSPAPEAPISSVPNEGDSGVAVSLMTILPADFPLPALTRFVPNPALRVATEQAATYALGVDVTGPEGLKRADMALTALRTSQKAIEQHFAEPADIANRLHKQITGTKAEWLQPGKAAIETVGRKMATEQRRLQEIEREERRKAQEEADRLAREAARREAEAAAKAQAPKPVVEELKRQAQTATAAPVAPSTPAPILTGSTVVTTWRARFTGTSGETVAAPCVDEMSPLQRERFLELVKAVAEGKAPLNALEPSWAYIQKRARADKSTLNIPGIEAYEDAGVRAKSVRRA